MTMFQYRIFYVCLCSITLYVQLCVSQTSMQFYEECVLSSPSIDLTLGAESDNNNNSLGNFLTIRWRHIPNLHENDTIVVWEDDYENSSLTPIEKHRIDKSSGFKLLNIRLDRYIMDDISKKPLTQMPKCLIYKVGLVREGEIMYTNCLQLHANWMQDISKYIYNFKITDLLFPGVDQSYVMILSPLEVLLFGGRYLKIAVFHDASNDQFLLEASAEFSLIRYLHEVYYFLNNSKEIVILEIVTDIKNQEIGQKLSEILVTLLKDQLVPKTMETSRSLKDLWQWNKRLILACSYRSNSDLIWEGIDNIFYNKEELSPPRVYHHLNSLWALSIDVSVEEDTFEKYLWKTVNIVTLLEFSRHTNIVDLIINANKMKKHCSHHQKPLKQLRKVIWKNRRNRQNLNYSLKACSNADSPAARVWPTVKAQPQFINGSLTFRLLQINWEAETIEEEDFLAIYEADPEEQNAKQEFQSLKPIFTAIPFATEGFLTSDISFQRPSISDLRRGGCIGPWVAFIRNNSLIASRCISSHPSWMWDNRATLGQHSLRSLIIPGTHNTGSFLVNDDLDPVSTWVVCQDEDVLSQLLYGIRYFDLRVGYYPDTDELLWINHDTIQWIPLEKVLNDVRAFSHLSPDPIILDIHRTPVGFDHDEAPILLVSLINKILGEFLAPYEFGNNVTLMVMWQSGKNILVSYGSSDLRDEWPWLWPPIFQAWANSQALDDLKAFIDEKMKEEQRKTFWAAMGHLTPSIWDIVFKADVGVRGMADKTGKMFTKWLQELWSDLSNIVTLDYFQTSDIIHTSINLNIMKHNCPEKLHKSQNLITTVHSIDDMAT